MSEMIAEKEVKISQNTKEAFLLAQYKELRSEILGIKERLIKIQLAGITAIPLILGSGLKYELLPIILASPFIAVAFSFMVIFEQASLMRAGAYLKDIEPFLIFDGIMGWEKWLQASPKRRIAENFFHSSILVIFAVYIVLGSYFSIAAIAKSTNYNIVIILLSTILYSGFSVWTFFILRNRLPSGTDYYK